MKTNTPRCPAPTIDAYGRPITYLRVSLTDRCNMQCIYCVPEHGRILKPRPDLLTNHELVRVIHAAAAAGFNKIRLTGGEPTLRPGLVDLVRTITAIPGIRYVMMSTNAVLLPQLAMPLKAAGLNRVNISIDSLKPERVHHLTGGGNLHKVWAGIKAAAAANLQPIRLNTVVMRNVNDDEVIAFAALTTRFPWEFRFIEMMPMVGVDQVAQSRFVSSAEIRDRIEAVYGPLQPVERPAGDPARAYSIPGAPGKLGFISSVSEPFCSQCNRMRLTADGQLHLCLLHDNEVDLRTPLRQGATDEDLEDLIRQAIQHKPWGHGLAQGILPSLRSMADVGG